MSQSGHQRPSRQCLLDVCITPAERTCAGHRGMSDSGHVWTAPAVQEESDISAKRSGAAMYPACFRLEDYLCRDAATVAAGPDVIR
jgi:hypothetical protein